MSTFSHFVHSIPFVPHHSDVVVRVRRHASERMLAANKRIDLELEQTFPASDPPSWNMGVSHPDEWR